MDIETTMEFLLEQQARFDQRMNQLTSNQIESGARHEREMLEIRTQLKRAVQMGVEEARRERQRRLEMHNELKDSIVEVSAELKDSIVEVSAELKNSIVVVSAELKNSIVVVSAELKNSIVALSAAQQVTEQKLQRLIDSLQQRQ